MKWERDLARRTLEEEKKRAYDHGYATGEHDCEEMLDEGKDEVDTSFQDVVKCN
jgi:hypothetical protein